MSKIDLAFVSRLINAITMRTGEEEETLFDRDLLKEGDPFLIEELEKFSQISLDGEPGGTLVGFNDPSELEARLKSFAKHRFTQHLSISALYSTPNEFMDENGDVEQRSNWYAVLEDQDDPNTFIALTLKGVSTEEWHPSSDLQIKVYPNLSYKDKEIVMTNIAIKALNNAIVSDSVTAIAHVLRRFISSYINMSTVINDSTALSSKDMSTLFLVFARTQVKAPVLPVGIAGVKWVTDSSDVVMDINADDGSHFIAQFQNGTFSSLNDPFPPKKRNETSLWSTIAATHIYAQTLAHETGQLTGEITQSKPAMSNTPMKTTTL